ncbi:heterogeneous nuclear ribonucleoprotein 1-like [Diospyros lotus]|uniref:heterogeneous nuclear ribonucleoprotein 1-like n=1 Tax=Diospyros lotus TaxID=55363 RepID=UPI002259CF14|nr:heterogeneous nuclear ribonucleoprotein 1-like [Diospyros lotus]XP_052183922.1 heterogeneous nuclear ribonucleoprotein 1-like [Diospyros lotus]XP_052183923.1 heterogeneous nuclear ribonucleoprotein 1-like [Diospyros lotus]XP_052183924.1 heterogeneous nuclear ribonucleoprotein 1-like [Diospyros lotus]
MEMEPGKLFIGGIAWDTNEDRLREYFQTFGDIVEAVIMKDRNTGRARGFGFVVFADPAVAERVVKEKHMIDGRTVEAKKAVPRDDQNMINRNNGSLQVSPGLIRTKKIFVGGLASTVTENDFKKYFDQFGTITDVVVMYDHMTQRPRGFGFITFDSEESVDKVLLKTFHELNGKMVEVKRAVPKELSPGPSRNQLSGYGYGLSRVSSFLNAYTQGYNPSSVGGYGMRLDGRFNPVTVGRSGYLPFNSPGYGMGLNFEPGLSPSYRGSGNFRSAIGYGRGLNPFHTSSPNRYSSPVEYGGGTGSILSSATQNMWGNGTSNYNSNSANYNDFGGPESGNKEFADAYGTIGAIWGSSNISGLVGGMDPMYSGGNLNTDNSFRSRVENYRKNSESSTVPTSSSDGLDGPLGNFYGGGSFYDNLTWQSSSPELESAGAFGNGHSKVTSDIIPKNSTGYIDGYTVTNRANRGIAA